MPDSGSPGSPPPIRSPDPSAAVPPTAGGAPAPSAAPARSVGMNAAAPAAVGASQLAPPVLHSRRVRLGQAAALTSLLIYLAWTVYLLVQAHPRTRARAAVDVASQVLVAAVLLQGLWSNLRAWRLLACGAYIFYALFEIINDLLDCTLLFRSYPSVHVWVSLTAGLLQLTAFYVGVVMVRRIAFLEVEEACLPTVERRRVEAGAWQSEKPDPLHDLQAIPLGLIRTTRRWRWALLPAPLYALGLVGLMTGLRNLNLTAAFYWVSVLLQWVLLAMVLNWLASRRLASRFIGYGAAGWIGITLLLQTGIELLRNPGETWRFLILHSLPAAWQTLPALDTFLACAFYAAVFAAGLLAIFAAFKLTRILLAVIAAGGFVHPAGREEELTPAGGWDEAPPQNPLRQ